MRQGVVRRAALQVDLGLSPQHIYSQLRRRIRRQRRPCLLHERGAPPGIGAPPRLGQSGQQPRVGRQASHPIGHCAGVPALIRSDQIAHMSCARRARQRVAHGLRRQRSLEHELRPLSRSVPVPIRRRLPICRQRVEERPIHQRRRLCITRLDLRPHQRRQPHQPVGQTLHQGQIDQPVKVAWRTTQPRAERVNRRHHRNRRQPVQQRLSIWPSQPDQLRDDQVVERVEQRFRLLAAAGQVALQLVQQRHIRPGHQRRVQPGEQPRVMPGHLRRAILQLRREPRISRRPRLAVIVPAIRLPNHAQLLVGRWSSD